MPLLTGVMPTAPRRNADPLSVMLVWRNATAHRRNANCPGRNAELLSVMLIGVMPLLTGVMPTAPRRNAEPLSVMLVGVMPSFTGVTAASTIESTQQRLVALSLLTLHIERSGHGGG